mgnify:CR=1 FL=1
MRISANISSDYFLSICIGIIFTVFISMDVHAQTEEDILNSIGNELNDESAKKKEMARIEKEYKSLKSSADGAYSSKKYEKAKIAYKKMIALKPDSDYASGRLGLIDQKIAQAKEAEIEKKYNLLIQQADGLLAAEKWADATSKYNAALGIRPEDGYAKGQVAKVSKLKTEALAAAKAAGLQKQYDDVLATAERALTAKNWDVAKSKFNEAAKLKPSESYPKEKAALMVKLKTEAIAKAKKEKLEKDYQTKIVKADQLLASKNWQGAILEYEGAKAMKPSDSYPSDQIKKANNRMAEEITNKRKAEELETNYQKHKKIGEDALSQKNWLVAIEAFTTASSLKPTSTEIKKLLNQAKSGKKTADDLALKAKADKEASEKLQKQFDSEMAKGAAALTAKNWAGARAAFNQAKSLKPEELAPESQLTKLDGLVAAEEKELAEAEAKKKASEEAAKARQEEEAQLAAEKKAAEEAKLVEDKRLAAEAAAAAEAKKQADAAAEQARLEEEAKIAAEVKAAEEARLAEAARIASENAEKEEQERLAAEATEKAKKEDEARLAREAAVAEKARLAEEAVAAGALAAKLKQKEEAEKAEQERLAAEAAQAEQDQLAQDQRNAEEAEKLRLSQEAEQNQIGFDKAVTDYKTAIKNSEWDLALRAINSAQTFIPENEALGKMQSELAALQKSETKALNAEKEKEAKALALEKQYQTLVMAGDAALSKKDFGTAKKSYTGALKVKAGEAYPQSQLDVVREMELASNAEALEAQREKDREYSQLMAKAEDAMNGRDWSSAKENFNKALKVKPENNGPKERLAAMEALIKKESELANAAAELDADYLERMNNGQKALDKQSFADAKRFFFGASKLKPKQELPKQKLEETESLWAAQVAKEKLLAAQQKSEELDSNYNGFIASGDKALENEMWDEAIKSYQGAIALKQEEAYPKQKLVEAKSSREQALSKANKERAEAEALAIKAEKERLKAEAEIAAKAELDGNFAGYMGMGDGAMASQDYKLAFRSYSKALELKPENASAQSKRDAAKIKFDASEADRLAVQTERKRLAAIELVKRKEVARVKREEYLSELRKNSPSELAKRYPDGITEEIDTENEMIVTKSIIVENNEGRYLIRFDYPWGEHFYYLDGKNIREDAYNWNIRKYKF